MYSFQETILNFLYPSQVDITSPDARVAVVIGGKFLGLEKMQKNHGSGSAHGDVTAAEKVIKNLLCEVCSAYLIERTRFQPSSDLHTQL